MLFCGVCAVCINGCVPVFQCHVSSVPVFNSMRKREIRPWGGVVTAGMIICLFVYTGTGPPTDVTATDPL